MLLADPAVGAPGADAVMARAGTENFPVASLFLPRRVRAHLLAVYGFARLVDELGDSTPGDRLAALDWLEDDLDRAFEGHAEHPLNVRLGATLRECALPREPFARLIEANRVDQRVSRYDSWEQLRAYCALSADPVGEIVLGVFGSSTPARVALSNSICTALQLTEHCQDVAEDLAVGRLYLPTEDLARFFAAEDLARLTAVADGARASWGVGGAQVAGGSLHVDPRAHAESRALVQEIDAPLRAVIAFEVSRARALLADGAPLIGELRGRERIAIAAFVAGGRAALDAIERARYDVLSGPPRAGRVRRLQVLAAVLARRSA